MNNLPMIGGDGNTKVPFFKKPGSVTGTILLILGGAFALIHINQILSFLNSLLANTLTFVGLCAVLAAVVYCILDPKIRNIISELYFMLVRKVMGLVVDMDPISIVKHHIEKMRDKIREIDRNMGSLRGLINESERTLKTKKSELETNITKFKLCTQDGKGQEAQMYANQVNRQTEFIQRQELRLADAKKWYSILSDLKYAAQITVKDTENEVNERVEEWNMIKKQHKVFTSVMGILRDNDQFKTFSMAMDKMSYDITQKLGDMENIINEAGGVMKDINLNNAVASQRAAELMERYDKYGIDGLLSNKPLQIEDKPSQSMADFKVTAVEVEKVEATSVGVNGENVQRRNWF